MPFTCRIIAMILASAWITGCLSLTSRDQIISVSTNPSSGREFYLEGQEDEVESAPAFLQINRERRIELVDDATRTPFKVECNVRWWSWTVSNLPFALFPIVIPGGGFVAGVLIDLLTGSMFDCPDVSVKISPKIAKKSRIKCSPTLVLNRSDLSENDMPKLVAVISRTEKPVGDACANHVLDQDRDDFLERYSLDFEQASALEQLERETVNEIGNQTHSDRILFVTGFDGIFPYELFDLHSKKVVAKGVARYQPTENTRGLWTHTRKIFRLIPNTVSLGVSAVTLRNDETDNSYDSFGDTGGGFRLMLDSVFHPYTLGTFDFSFYISSPARFYSIRYEGDPFLDDASLRERYAGTLDSLPTTLELLYLGLAVGPAIEINTPAGQLGTAIRFGGGYLDVTNSRGGSQSSWVRDWDFSIYYYFFLHRSFLLGLTGSGVSFNRPPVDTEFMTVSQLTSVNLFFGYYFGDLRSYF